MAWERVRQRLRLAYPGCSERELDDLISAMRNGKYWRVHPERGGAVYAVALTQAKIPFREGFAARTTAPKPVAVSKRCAGFMRRARVLVAKDAGDHYISETVLEWPAFLRLVREKPDAVYSLLVENPSPPRFINRASIGRVLKEVRR